MQASDVRWRIKIIFIYYSSFADRNNFKFLKQQNYRRFLIDSQIVKNQNDFPAYDIAFRKINHNSIDFQSFLQLIPTLALIIYSKETRVDAFNKIMKIHLENLYAQILQNSEFGTDINTIFNLKLDPKSIQLMQNSIPLKRSYNQYIISTSMHQKDADQTFQKLYVFLKDFELSPHLVTKAISYIIFHYLLRKKRDSFKFQLDDFRDIVIYIGQVYYLKEFQEGFSQAAIIIKTLQKMQLSFGFQKMVLKYQTEHSSQTLSFFKNFNYHTLSEINGDESIENLNRSIEKIWPASTRHKHCSSIFSSKKKQRKNDFSTMKQMLKNEEKQSSAGNLARLKIIFNYLCSIGQVANHKTLKSIKIKKYFQQINIAKSLSQSWLDLSITDLCRSSPSGKIEFSQFLDLLNLCSQKMLLSYQNFISYLIENTKLPDNNMSSRVKTQNSYCNNFLIRDMINHLQKPLERIFNYYSKSKPQITFEQVVKLTYDFQIFPTIIAKAKLYQHFLNSAEQNQIVNELKKLTKQSKITLSGFKQLLIKISQQISDNSLNQQQKIIILLQKMHESNGHKLVLLGKGFSLISQLRSKFSHVYKMNFSQKSKDQVETFGELLQQYETPS